MFMFLIGTFLLNSLHALLLFDSGAIHSFVSQSFSMRFNMTLGELECKLQISIANEHRISTSSVF